MKNPNITSKTSITELTCAAKNSGLGDAIQNYKINNEKMKAIIEELRSRLSNVLRFGEKGDSLKAASSKISSSSTFVRDLDEANEELAGHINDISGIIDGLDM